MNINNNAINDSSISKRLKTMLRERVEKVQSYKSLDDKKRSFCAGLLIQAVLGDIDIQTDKFGKPYAKECPHFSISHSGEWATLALCGTFVGIDIEKNRSYSLKKIEAMAKRFLHPREVKTIYDAPNDIARQSLFIKYWVLKESYLKMKGTGFFANVSSAYFLIKGQTAIIESEPDIKLTLYDIQGIPTGYTAAVCSSNLVIWPGKLQILNANDFLD